MDFENLSTDAYKLLDQGVDYAIYTMERNRRVATWSPGAERTKGYTADEIVGTHFSRFYADENRAAGVPENALRTATEPGPVTTEAWRCRTDGSRFWAIVPIDAIRRGGGLRQFKASCGFSTC